MYVVLFCLFVKIIIISYVCVFFHFPFFSNQIIIVPITTSPTLSWLTTPHLTYFIHTLYTQHTSCIMQINAHTNNNQGKYIFVGSLARNVPNGYCVQRRCTNNYAVCVGTLWKCKSFIILRTKVIIIISLFVLKTKSTTKTTPKDVQIACYIEFLPKQLQSNTSIKAPPPCLLLDLGINVCNFRLPSHEETLFFSPLFSSLLFCNTFYSKRTNSSLTLPGRIFIIHT